MATAGELSASAVQRRILRRQRTRIGVSVVFLCSHQAAEALVPVMIGVVIDRAVDTSDARALLLSLAGLALLFTVLAFSYFFGARLGYAAVEHESHTTRVEIARRALDPRGLRAGLRDGELLSVTATDAELSTLVLRAAGVAAAAITALAVSATALLVVDVPLGLGVLLGVPLVVLALQRLAPLLTRRSEAQQEALATTTALAVDLVSGLRVLRGIGAQDHAARRYAAASSHALGVTLRAANTKGLHLGLTTAVNGLFLAAVAGVAGWLALRGRLTVGELVAVIGLAQFIAEPVQTLGWCVQLFATAKASATRVGRVLGAAPLVTPGSATPGEPAETRLALDGVAYRNLDGVSLTVGAGEIVGVVAYDPRDADALVTLLSGRVPREDYRGAVRIDGVPAETLTLDAARGALLVEQHDVALFEGTLRTNLAAGTAADGDEPLLGALRAAGAEDVVDAHPDGLDRVLTERGANLSGGQRQRVGLARALAADPPVLVLHEPTTSVDAVTEGLVADGLTAARGTAPRGTLVITSSPALLRAAHRIAVLDGGRVVAEGTHDALAAADARYREAVLR
ncbi:ABC transporter ATP-binding protein [Catenuloplanes atrovinosus]|uniref:ABC transport system ATP-binding protein n=1 Tax=Catenuloplanes atrovinosus TaxID=137266 RepID=A0AAE3YPS0_9ACTN|nr:ABC transporter ATP-binding protein [Catenuloplanes atrovinosus]MDR7276400.1 putative ABC transport system ATP-binding protein [Catenuloplanes atrovinosus]